MRMLREMLLSIQNTDNNPTLIKNELEDEEEVDMDTRTRE